MRRSQSVLVAVWYARCQEMVGWLVCCIFLVLLRSLSYTYRDRILVRQGISTRNKVFFRFGRSFFVKDLYNTRFELCDIRDMMGRNAIFPGQSRQND